MFNLKKKHDELSALANDLRDIKAELTQAMRYYIIHPEDHIPAFSDKTVAPERLDQVRVLIDDVNQRYWDVNSELNKRKYKLFVRK